MSSWQALYEALVMLAPIFLTVTVLAFGMALLYGWVESTPQVLYGRRAGLFGMASTFGSVMGCIMGASESLPAANILNILVPLVSGYIAYITSKDLAPEIKMFVPGAVAALLLALLISFWHMRLYFK